MDTQKKTSDNPTTTAGKTKTTARAAKTNAAAKTAAKPTTAKAAAKPAAKSGAKKPAKKPVKKAELLRRSPDLEDEYGLKLFFQPVYQLSQDRVYGYECLLRIVDKELGTITPDLFLSVARKNPTLMKGIEEWSLREIFKTSKLFRENKRYVEMLSLNIDTSNFIKKDFYSKVSLYLEKITENIYFELKEDVFFDGDKTVVETLQKLRDAGIKIAVDDFTANFLTFDWGSEVPFDMIKIERTYIDRFLTSPKARLIVEKIVEFAKERNLELVAVGVENSEQEQALGKLGIDKMQGYYYSKPMQFKRLLDSEAKNGGASKQAPAAEAKAEPKAAETAAEASASQSDTEQAEPQTAAPATKSAEAVQANGAAKEAANAVSVSDSETDTAAKNAAANNKKESEPKA